MWKLRKKLPARRFFTSQINLISTLIFFWPFRTFKLYTFDMWCMQGYHMKVPCQSVFIWYVVYARIPHEGTLPICLHLICGVCKDTTWRYHANLSSCHCPHQVHHQPCWLTLNWINILCTYLPIKQFSDLQANLFCCSESPLCHDWLSEFPPISAIFYCQIYV